MTKSELKRVELSKSEEPFGQGYHKTKDALSLLRTLKLIASAFSWTCFFNRLQ